MYVYVSVCGVRVCVFFSRRILESANLDQYRMLEIAQLRGIPEVGIAKFYEKREKRV
jgi:hypothetical protein